MKKLDNFDRQLKEHDLPLVFALNGNDGDKVLKDALSKADQLFNPYAHLLLDEDGGWVANNWQSGDAYGYRLSDQANGTKSPRTPLDYDQCLAALDPQSVQINRNTCMYLFTNRPGHWNITRHGNGIKSVIGSAEWSVLEAKPDALGKKVNDAINAIGAFRSEVDNCATFFNDVIETRHWKQDRDITVLVHMVWPKFYPVWYKGTEDGYSQIPGIDKLLEALGTEIGLLRRPINLRDNYEQYASAYRVLLRLYHQFVYKDEQKPRETPHFDYFTHLLAVLDPCREALRMLLDRKALVLYGVPGTGKTHTALKELAPALAEENHIKTVQFHPGYSYADFIIGIKPRSDGKDVTYPVEPGDQAAIFGPGFPGD
jgi:hypothetical protein